jgi:hypothetical protein
MEVSAEMKKQILYQFSTLRQAVVDASSIIYMHKAGFLSEVAAVIRLYSPEDVLKETKLQSLAVHPIKWNQGAASNDQKLMSCAMFLGLPVIADDRKILLRLDREKISYFNALMMLHFLLFRGRIATERHRLFFQKLKDCAWYSSSVLTFAKAVYFCVLEANHQSKKWDVGAKNLPPLFCLSV